MYRAPLNALYKSPVDPNVLVAELVLPPEIGGWWIRELGLEDADGNFIAVAKPPPSYKPLLQQGSGRTQTIRMHVVFGNVANISLKIDPSIVLATRDYVDKAREANELYARNQVKAHSEAADPHPQYLRRADVAKDAGPLAWVGLATGAANALVLTLKSSEAVLPAYAAGQRFQFQAAADNTGAVTAKVAGLAVVAVKKASAAGLVDLVAGDIRAGVLFELSHNGTVFQLREAVADAYRKDETYSQAEVNGLVGQATEQKQGTIKIATDAQMLDGANDSVVATPKKFRKGFAISLATNGYIAFPTWLGGLVVQWGTTATLVGDSDNAVPFQMAFPNAGLVAHVTPLNTDSSLYKDNTGQVKSITATTLTIRCNVISGNMTYSPYMWFALGY